MSTRMKEEKGDLIGNQTRNLWQFPWNYRESFIIAAGLLLTGFLLQASTRIPVTGLSSPANYIAGGLFIVILLWLHFKSKTNPLVKWLRSVPASISSLAMLLLLAVIMGTVPQQNFVQGVKPDLLGLNNITSSWPFVISLVFMLTNLGLATLGRLFPFHIKNIGFVLNHLGLFVALFAGMLGTADLQRYTMDLYEGKPEWRAMDDKQRVVEMPFAIKLDKFNMETFTPKLAFADIKNNSVQTKGVNALRMIHKGDKYEQSGYSIEVLDYIENSIFAGERYHPVNEVGAIPAALVRVHSSAIDTTGWISCGSFATEFAAIQLNEHLALVMLQPEAKKYSSEVQVLIKDGGLQKASIEVNKPYAINGWKAYQLSYDERFGKYSKLSVIELVRDPWLPAVYIGLFMMIAGAIYIIFKGKAD